MGNNNKMHAKLAPGVTDLIDSVVYDGRCVRREVARAISQVASRMEPDVLHHTARIWTPLLEVGCGTGTLTRELDMQSRFAITAVDTSPAMLDVARKRVQGGADFRLMNGADCSAFDVTFAVCAFCMHEMPTAGHLDVAEAMCHATSRGGEVWIVDIDPSYRPSPLMLMGEPYLPNYLRSIEHTLSVCARWSGRRLDSFEILSGHVRGWVLR